jgi:hypothetical protein
MFAEEPKERVIRRVAAFMYGNCVTVSDAVACYNACNGLHRRYVESSLKAWYQAWNRDEGKEDEYYYSLTLKRLVCLKTGDRCEYLSEREFGPERTACPLLICAKIDYIRRGVE